MFTLEKLTSECTRDTRTRGSASSALTASVDAGSVDVELARWMVALEAENGQRVVREPQTDGSGGRCRRRLLAGAASSRMDAARFAVNFPAKLLSSKVNQ